MKPFITTALLLLFAWCANAQQDFSPKFKGVRDDAGLFEKHYYKNTGSSDFVYSNNDSEDYVARLKDASTGATLAVYTMYAATSDSFFGALADGDYTIEITRASNGTLPFPSYVQASNYSQNQTASGPVTYTPVPVYTTMLIVTVW